MLGKDGKFNSDWAEAAHSGPLIPPFHPVALNCSLRLLSLRSAAFVPRLETAISICWITTGGCTAVLQMTTNRERVIKTACMQMPKPSSLAELANRNQSRSTRDHNCSFQDEAAAVSDPLFPRCLLPHETCTLAHHRTVFRKRWTAV